MIIFFILKRRIHDFNWFKPCWHKSGRGHPFGHRKKFKISSFTKNKNSRISVNSSRVAVIFCQLPEKFFSLSYKNKFCQDDFPTLRNQSKISFVLIIKTNQKLQYLATDGYRLDLVIAAGLVSKNNRIELPSKN